MPSICAFTAVCFCGCYKRHGRNRCLMFELSGGSDIANYFCLRHRYFIIKGALSWMTVLKSLAWIFQNYNSSRILHLKSALTIFLSVLPLFAVYQPWFSFDLKAILFFAKDDFILWWLSPFNYSFITVINPVGPVGRGGGRYSIYPWVGRCGPAPQTLTLFKIILSNFWSLV